jgi:hypothetical protein
MYITLSKSWWLLVASSGPVLMSFPDANRSVEFHPDIGSGPATRPGYTLTADLDESEYLINYSISISFKIPRSKGSHLSTKYNT